VGKRKRRCLKSSELRRQHAKRKSAPLNSKVAWGNDQFLLVGGGDASLRKGLSGPKKCSELTWVFQGGKARRGAREEWNSIVGGHRTRFSIEEKIRDRRLPLPRIAGDDT